MEPPAPVNEQRLVEIQRLIDEVVARRLGGENPSDADVLSSHPHLLPELQHELENLRLIERARRRATGSSDPRALAPFVARNAAATHVDRERFPGYELRGEPLRGGQGAVYRAWHPAMRREVAIKVMGSGASATPHEMVRFEREIEILAGLRHPNIVAVHDSGVSSDGGLYFVMDYVEGRALDEHFRNGSPPDAAKIRTIIDTFLGVCEAIQSAHLRGVIHRDIKPSNIRIDSEGRPRVLDFGLAKLLSSPIDDPQLVPTMTASGQFIGSLPWASPEQAEGSADLDLRTDVYSLGVVLYHLLTRQFPYEVRGLHREVADRITREAPKPPSSLNAALDTELETVVLKCLAKERERRYQTAGELHADLRRWRTGEPVEARRDSAWYLVRKTMHRHGAAVGVAGGFVGLLTVSAIALSFMYRAQTQERARAELLADEAQAQTEIAKTQRDAADSARKQAEAVTNFVNEMLASANPDEGKRSDVTVREVLDRAAARVDASFDDQPEVEAAIRGTLAEAYSGVGEYDQALLHAQTALELRRASADESPLALAIALKDVGTCLGLKGEPRESLKYHREALATIADVRDAPLADRAGIESRLAMTLIALGEFAEAEEILRRVLADLDAAGLKDIVYASASSELGRLMVSTGRRTEPLPLFQQAVEIYKRLEGPNSANVAGLSYNVGVALWYSDQREEAVKTLSEGLELARQALPADHPTIALCLSGLGAFHLQLGDEALAESMISEAYALFKSRHGASHSRTVAAAQNLCLIYENRGQYEKAEAIYREQLDIQRAAVGPDHPTVASLVGKIGRLYQDQGRLAEAEPWLRDAVDIYSRAFPGPHPSKSIALSSLAALIGMRGDEIAAARLMREALDMQRAVLPAGAPELAGPLGMLGKLLMNRGDFAAAEPLLRECVEIREQHQAHHFLFPEARCSLGRALLGLNRLEEAEPLLVAGYAGLKEHANAPPEFLTTARQALIELYEKTNRPDLAAPLRE